jgi:tRNA (mo5U34)-methyltransferase
MSTKLSIYAAAKKVTEARTKWHDIIVSDPEFRQRGGLVYPYDTTAANLDPMFELFEQTGFAATLDRGEIKSVCDIGCANGDLSFSFACAGFDVTAVDYSFKHDQAPFIVSRVAELESCRLAVVDRSVDGYFNFSDLVDANVNDQQDIFPSSKRFDLVICLGLLYHLKNPFAFLESMASISRYALIGTHIFTHTPELRARIDDVPVAYLVDSKELNSDPTNYWIFSEKAFARLANRCGFEILGSLLIPNNLLNIALPNRTDLGIRNFLMLRTQHVA